MADSPEQKETKQLTTGEDGDKSLVAKVKDTAGALKDRAIDEAKGYSDPQDTQLWKSIFSVSHDPSAAAPVLQSSHLRCRNHCHGTDT